MRQAGARLLVVIALLWGGAISTTPVASAQEASATPPEATPAPLLFGIYPVGNFSNQYFEVEIAAGDSMRLTAGITNAGAEPIVLRTFAANAFNPPNGGFAAATEEEAPAGPTLWLDYPAETFELVPGEAREREFTVTVPAGTPPGHYVTALVVRTADALPIPGSEIFQQVVRGAISVEITVPGPVAPGFELGAPTFSIDAAVHTLIVPITNTGNVLLKPEGTVSLTTPEGEEVLTSTVQMGSVYGGSATVVQVSLPEQLPAGEYRVAVDLVDPETGTSAVIPGATVTLADPGQATVPTLVVGRASVTPRGDPVGYADVSATITNAGPAIPTASITLRVERDGEAVESYPLAQNQALPQGSTDFSQRYIPLDGWQEGTYTFELVITAVSDGTETTLATIAIEGEIVVP